MPKIPLYPPSTSLLSAPTKPSSLPKLLNTPSGLAVLEIQGTLHLPPPPAAAPDELSAETQSIPHTDIGRLVFPSYSPANPPDDTAWMKKVYLYVGKHQRLSGEVKKLAKPLAVIRKRAEPGDGQREMEEEELEIAEIIRYKILFSHRPEPVGSED